MTTYKVVHNEIHRVIRTAEDEFDVTDQAKWNWLRSAVADNGREEELEDFPEDAPEDPQVWLELYKFLNIGEYDCILEDDWVSDRKGYTETTWKLEDADGNKIELDEYDE